MYLPFSTNNGPFHNLKKAEIIFLVLIGSNQAKWIIFALGE